MVDVQDSTKNRVLSQRHKKCCKAELYKGTIISFSGTIKNKQLDKDIFDLDSINIGRIDLCYDLKFKQSDCVQTLDSFLKNSCNKINSKVDHPKAEVVFRVGKHSSLNYFRVYPKSNGKIIRFELELKKSAVKKFQSYLFLHQFEKWEELLTCHFYKEAMNKIDLDSPYTDWLITNSRKIRAVEMAENCLLTTYVNLKGWYLVLDGLTNEELLPLTI